MSENDPIEIPKIQDKTQAPKGAISRNAQPMLLGGIALLMIVVIVFSNHTTATKEPRNDAPPPGGTANGPNPATIDDFVLRVDDRAKKMAEAKAALDEEQRSFGARNSVPAPARGSDGYYDAPPPRAGYRPDDVRASPPPKSPAEVEAEKREALAPYAPIVALSYRQTPPPTIAQAPSNASGPASGQKVPSVLDLLNNDALLASVAAAQIGASTQRTALAPSNTPAPAIPAAGTSASKPASPASSSEVSTPAGRRYTLFEGSIIETSLTNRIDATFSGPVVSIVTTDVYSQDGRHLMIPRGTRAVGEVHQVDNLGQQRVAVGFHRLIFPNGQSALLDSFVGMNQIGETGLRDQVNHHYFQIFGAAIAVGAISGLTQSTTNVGAGATQADVYQQGVSSSLAQSSMHILDRFLNILPTFTIREGHRIKVYLSQDLELPEYVGEGGN